MTLHTTDKSVLGHIEELVAEEKKLYAQGEMSDAERERLAKINVELDRCWDLLRQRRGARRVRPQSRRGRGTPGEGRRELQGLKPDRSCGRPRPAHRCERDAARSR